MNEQQANEILTRLIELERKVETLENKIEKEESSKVDVLDLSIRIADVMRQKRK